MDDFLVRGQAVSLGSAVVEGYCRYSKAVVSKRHQTHEFENDNSFQKRFKSRHYIIILMGGGSIVNNERRVRGSSEVS